MAAQAGIYYSDSRPVSRDTLSALSRLNVRLGPDRTGVYVADGIAMLSFAQHFDRLSTFEKQPVHSADGSVMTWDGRLDNRDDFIVRLQAGLNDDYSDARLMAHAIQKWHDLALAEAIGDWSLACWNGRQREVVLARDYAGNRPLYYCCRPDFC